MMDTRTVDNKKFRGQSRTRSTESLFFFPLSVYGDIENIPEFKESMGGSLHIQASHDLRVSVD